MIVLFFKISYLFFSKDVELCGKKFPKDTVLVINIYGIHNDASIWGDPDNFRPGNQMKMNKLWFTHILTKLRTMGWSCNFWKTFHFHSFFCRSKKLHWTKVCFERNVCHTCHDPPKVHVQIPTSIPIYNLHRFDIELNHEKKVQSSLMTIAVPLNLEIKFIPRSPKL